MCIDACAFVYSLRQSLSNAQGIKFCKFIAGDLSHPFASICFCKLILCSVLDFKLFSSIYKSRQNSSMSARLMYLNYCTPIFLIPSRIPIHCNHSYIPFDKDASTRLFYHQPLYPFNLDTSNHTKCRLEYKEIISSILYSSHQRC
jgi:hypothetical protein